MLLPVVPGKYEGSDSLGFTWQMRVSVEDGELDYVCEALARGAAVCGRAYADCECCGVEVILLVNYGIAKWEWVDV